MKMPIPRTTSRGFSLNGKGTQPLLVGYRLFYLAKVDVLTEVEQNEECTFLERFLGQRRKRATRLKKSGDAYNCD